MGKYKHSPIFLKVGLFMQRVKIQHALFRKKILNILWNKEWNVNIWVQKIAPCVSMFCFFVTVLRILTIIIHFAQCQQINFHISGFSEFTFHAINLGIASKVVLLGFTSNVKTYGSQLPRLHRILLETAQCGKIVPIECLNQSENTTKMWQETLSSLGRKVYEIFIVFFTNSLFKSC